MAHVRFLFSFFIFRDFFLYCVCSIVREYLLNNHVTPLVPATEIVFLKNVLPSFIILAHMVYFQ
jgi:hypothetical protein